MKWTDLFYATLSKSPALQAVVLYCVVTTGYKRVVMKISPFRTSCRTDLKSLPMYIGIHNRMVIDLRKKHPKKASACKAVHN